MAKKPTPAPFSKAPVKAPVVSPVRNTVIPKAPAHTPATAKKEISFDMISRRAYEIHLSGKGGSQDDNWFRAERELRGL